MSTQYVAWANGVWAAGFWAEGFWEGAEAPPEPVDPDRLPLITPAPGGPGSQMSLRQMLRLRRRRRERKAFAAGIF